MAKFATRRGQKVSEKKPGWAEGLRDLDRKVVSQVVRLSERYVRQGCFSRLGRYWRTLKNLSVKYSQEGSPCYCSFC